MPGWELPENVTIQRYSSQETRPWLSLAQWQALQLYLVDAMNLSAAAQMKLPADVISIYKDLGTGSDIPCGTLSQAQVVGNTLYGYGRYASLTFQAVVKLMDQRTPNKDAILQALGNLQQVAEKNKLLAQGWATALQASSHRLSKPRATSNSPRRGKLS